LKTAVVFDQSVFVKLAIGNVTREAAIGLVLTGVMILIFLGSPRATIAVLLSVPLSMVVCLLITNYMGGSINTMILGGLALVFSRLIDNGVIVLENIFRHMEMGESRQLPRNSAERRSRWPCLLPRSPPPSCFFQSRFLMASANISSLRWRWGRAFDFRLVLFAMTVVPLYCAKFIHVHHGGENQKQSKPGLFARFERLFNDKYERMLNWYESLAKRAMQKPGLTAALILGGVVLVLVVTFPFLGRAYFPRTDPGQFIINVRMPSGTRLEVSNDYIAKVEALIRGVVPPKTWT